MPHALFAQCVPKSATLYASADDELNIWINGNLITTTPVSFVTAPGTLPTYNIPVGDINTGTNVISAENINLAPTEIVASWVIDVTCQSGDHAYFSNTDPGYLMYDDTTGTTPPAPSGGYAWNSPNYPAASIATYFTGTPVNNVSATNDPWLQAMYNPETGQLQPFTSDNSTGSSSSSNQIIYYRGSFNLNAVPYTPPSFTIQKIAAFATYPQSYSTGTEPYTIVVCNNGAPVNTPVTIWDQINQSLAVGGGYDGPNPSYNPPSGQLYSATNTTNGVLFVFPLGFAGDNSCVTLYAPTAYINTIQGSPCSIVNNAGVSWNGAEQASANVGVSVGGNCDSTNTFTSTPTYTYTRTNTPTPTYTYTWTQSPTPTSTLTSTRTFTVTNTPTQTPTATFTNTFTRSFTPTSTWTATPTNTPTSTFTPSNTPTRSFTPTSTFTATYTNSPTPTFTVTNTITPTNTYTPTNTSTRTNTPTASYTPTWTNTPIPGATNTFTFTITNTMTSTWTSTATFTPTPSSTPTATSTKTNTASSTYTFTATNTSTSSFTPTVTYTPTWTYTPIPGATNTYTYTITNTTTSTWTFTATFTPTASRTFTWSPTATFTYTSTPTPTSTWTFTRTPSPTSTQTSTPSFTFSPTWTSTLMVSSTPTFSPTIVPQCDTFYVSENELVPSQGPVSIYVDYCGFPGPYSLKVYNTAGEFIRDLSKDANPPSPSYLSSLLPPQSYHWYGTNFANNPCASGVYILYLVEPFDRKIKKLILIR